MMSKPSSNSGGMSGTNALALYGLDLRFKAVERKLRADRQRNFNQSQVVRPSQAGLSRHGSRPQGKVKPAQASPQSKASPKKNEVRSELVAKVAESNPTLAHMMEHPDTVDSDRFWADLKNSL